MAQYYRVRNWAKFQHYKDRNPPWIKLHKALLDDCDYQSLPLASMALAPMLWLLASETVDGRFEGDHQKLAFRLRRTVREIDTAINPLIAAGFIELVQDASGVLAECYQGATPETERETQVQSQRKKIPRASRFGDFWAVCPKKVGKGKAQPLFEKASVVTSPDLLIAAMSRYAAGQVGKDPAYIAHPATWLSQRRWEDEDSVASTNILPFKLSAEEQAAEAENLKRFREQGLIQ